MKLLGPVLAKARQTVYRLERWLEVKYGRKTFLRYKPEDQIRILKLQVWADRNGVLVEDVFEILIPKLKPLMAGKGKDRGGLGIGVRTLTGQAARDILEDSLAKLYPDKEHLSVMREREKDKQLQAELDEDSDGFQSKSQVAIYKAPLDAPSLQNFIETYKKRVIKVRQSNETESRKKWRKRKRYRGNPWI